jgi:hypothetical protein
MVGNDNKKLLVPCHDYCGIVAFERDEDDNTLYIQHYESSFYSHQSAGWTALKSYFSRIWKAIKGKDYSFFDIVLMGKDVDKFYEDMKNFIDNNHSKV